MQTQEIGAASLQSKFYLTSCAQRFVYTVDYIGKHHTWKGYFTYHGSLIVTSIDIEGAGYVNVKGMLMCKVAFSLALIIIQYQPISL